jgi:hypothetical protein
MQTQVDYENIWEEYFTPQQKVYSEYCSLTTEILKN